ncbi:MAG: segregation/condensation protein A, partial [Gammaproteobacteria bacterium]|nr:segregation/condensation protein A [Gammaproteobacteria bacterium]
YLIKRQNLDILNIPVAEITRQYMVYVELMKAVQLELAAEYLVMAAMLAEIKSRLLLPRSPDVDAGDEDPRAELVRRLQEYERFKQAAESIDQLPREGRDTVTVSIDASACQAEKLKPVVTLREVMLAFKDVLKRAEMFSHHQIKMEPLSVRERMSHILGCLGDESFVEFTQLFSVEEGRGGVVVSLLAILELIKGSVIEMIQSEPFGPIYVKKPGLEDESTTT